MRRDFGSQECEMNIAGWMQRPATLPCPEQGLRLAEDVGNWEGEIGTELSNSLDLVNVLESPINEQSQKNIVFLERKNR